MTERVALRGAAARRPEACRTSSIARASGDATVARELPPLLAEPSLNREVARLLGGAAARSGEPRASRCVGNDPASVDWLRIARARLGDDGSARRAAPRAAAPVRVRRRRRRRAVRPRARSPSTTCRRSRARARPRRRSTSRCSARCSPRSAVRTIRARSTPFMIALGQRAHAPRRRRRARRARRRARAADAASVAAERAVRAGARRHGCARGAARASRRRPRRARCSRRWRRPSASRR